MRTNIKHLALALIAFASIALVALPTCAQPTPLTYTAAFTNNPTITNGVTTFAGTTNVTVDVYQGKGIGFTFSALCTNAAQLNFYLSPSMDGTNFADVSGSWIWGSTMIANSWITRSTNIPASIADNYRKIKVLIVSNAAATVYLTNSGFSRRP